MRAVVLAAILSAAGGVLHAQSGIATGSLRGQVRDLAGEPLSEVRVTATEVRTGLRRSQSTDSQGRFELLLLPPGEYTVAAELAGFATSERRQVRLRVGETRSLRLGLEPATVTDLLLVSGAMPLVDTSRTSSTDTIERRAIEVLPSNGRDFRDLMLLAPQVGESQGRPTVAGGEGMMNSFNVDGADSNSLFLPPFSYSQAAIREFQLLRSSYNVRFGGAAGGIVNAVTKSGTNDWRGGAFAFFQDGGMVAADALGNEQDEFERRQLGVDLGGPIRRDRLHLFLAYDSQRRDQNALRRPLGLAPGLTAAFDAKLLSLGIDPESEFDYIITNDADVVLLRLDWALGDRHRLWLRNNFSDQGGDNSTFAYLTSGRSNLGREESSFNSSAASLISVLGGRTFHELIAQHSPATRPRRANSTAVPQTAIGVFDAVIGQGLILPSSFDEERLQLQDNLTLQRGDHSVRLGLDYNRIEARQRFLLSGGGYYLIPTYEEFLRAVPCAVPVPGQPPCIYIQAFSQRHGRVELDTQLVALHAGDLWRPRPNLTLEYGLRLEHQENPSAQNPNPLVPGTAVIPDDTNLAPRLGFAWDVMGDGRAVLRGGVGLFHGWTPSLLIATAISSNGVNGSSLFLFQGFSPVFPRYPERLPPEAAGIGGPPPDIFLFSPDFENPQTKRLSLGYERAVGEELRLGAELTYSKSSHRARQLDVNLDPTPSGFFADGRPIYGGPGARLDPRFGQQLQFTSDAEAEYLSLVLSAVKRYSHNWSARASYTYAESRDHDSAETDQIVFLPEDHFNLDQDWGWSDRDVRQRLVVAGSWAAPRGFTLSFVGSYRSALPINAFAGSDLNNDGSSFDRPGPDPVLGLDSHLRRNSFRGSSAAALDLRLAKAFSFSEDRALEAMIEIFNLTDEEIFVAFDPDYLRFGQPNPEFGMPLRAARPRSLQLGLRYRF
jgi:hypothetical protein